LLEAKIQPLFELARIGLGGDPCSSQGAGCCRDSSVSEYLVLFGNFYSVIVQQTGGPGKLSGFGTFIPLSSLARRSLVEEGDEGSDEGDDVCSDSLSPQECKTKRTRVDLDRVRSRTLKKSAGGGRLAPKGYAR